MELREAKEILNRNGFLLEDRFDSEPITVEYIDEDNYKDYIGKYVNVTGNVTLNGLGLIKLPIKFGKVGGDFWCCNNKLISLEGAPVKVGGEFWCYNNKLTTLKGSPKEVGSSFKCSNNKLTTLEGSPNEVGDFECDSNNLTSLDGAPKEVRGHFACGDNAVQFTEDDVLSVSNAESVDLT